MAKSVSEMAPQDIEKKAAVGGLILVARQMLGMGISLLSMLLITKMLGPTLYGITAIVTGMMGYLVNVGRLGLDTYLIRTPESLSARDIGATQTLYILVAGILSLLVALTAPLIATWYQQPLLVDLLRAYACILPLNLLCFVPAALLDRSLNYRSVALVELVGQIVYFIVALTVVRLTGSVWGPILGIALQAVTTLVMTSYLAEQGIKLTWSPREMKKQLNYGISYSCSIWVWQLRDLANPLIVGKLLGSEAVAFVAMAIRLGSMIGFAKSAIWRVYMSYLAKLQNDLDQMKTMIERGLSFQVLTLAAFFIGFMTVAPDVIRLIMGAKWVPVLEVFPFIALGLVMNAGFSLHSSALYVFGYNRDVTRFHIVHVMLFWVASALLMHMGWGILGFGWAEIIATGSYVVISRAVRNRLFELQETDLILNALVVACVFLIFGQLGHDHLWLRLIVGMISVSGLLILTPRNRLVLRMAQRLLRDKIRGGFIRA